jgi:DNA-binding NarL/FixJ family response regulator
VSGPGADRVIGKKIAVFLVDDHAIIRDGLKLLINGQIDMHVVGETGHGRNLGQFVQESGAEVVIMDVSMPGVGGARATADLKRQQPGIVVLALTRHGEKGYLRQMLDNGASGYVLKQAPAGELINALRTVCRGGTYIDPSIAGKIIPRHHGQRLQPGEHLLTDREQEIATMIALGHTNKEVASLLGISVKTVEAHKTNVMEKLEITSRAGLVRFAITHGWLGAK